MSDFRLDALSTSRLMEMAAGRDTQTLQEAFAPAHTHHNFNPLDEVKMSLALLARNAGSRPVIEWLLDLTMRAPYPVTSQNRDDLAFAAAKHQARAAVGETILVAIREGEKLLDQKAKGSNDEKPS